MLLRVKGMDNNVCCDIFLLMTVSWDLPSLPDCNDEWRQDLLTIWEGEKEERCTFSEPKDVKLNQVKNTLTWESLYFWCFWNCVSQLKSFLPLTPHSSSSYDFLKIHPVKSELLLHDEDCLEMHVDEVRGSIRPSLINEYSIISWNCSRCLLILRLKK